ncbi:MAG: hypothetical protein US20_C0012G0001, partial [Candidatus Pacebacteria bacterium GW2011_GWF1_36_5]
KKEYIKSKAIECSHHIYNVVEYDSETEKEFAKALEDYAQRQRRFGK